MEEVQGPSHGASLLLGWTDGDGGRPSRGWDGKEGEQWTGGDAPRARGMWRTHPLTFPENTTNSTDYVLQAMLTPELKPCPPPSRLQVPGMVPPARLTWSRVYGVSTLCLSLQASRRTRMAFSCRSISQAIVSKKVMLARAAEASRKTSPDEASWHSSRW